MSFPFDDRFWVAAASFLTEQYRPGDKIVAPELFWRIVPEVYRYSDTSGRALRDYDFVVLHKGQLDELDRSFLREVATAGIAMFANEVFIIYASQRQRHATPIAASEHVAALAPMIAALPPAALPLVPSPPAPDVIRSFAALSDVELREAMNAFWLDGGYAYETARDQAYSGEIDAYLVDFIGDAAGCDLLALCCGDGHHLGHFTRAGRVMGIDLSDVAVEMAKAKLPLPNFQFQQMDAQHLGFKDASFDIVLFSDAIEHVRDAEAVLKEAARVLRPQGLLFITVANRDSLHQVMTRKLGYPEFRTNHHHIREFSMGETRRMLANAGFGIAREGGIFLFAYWGIPGIDHLVRHLIDDDAEVVELHRTLGRAVGADHAYCSVALARKIA
jgi:SAM-dependent methyltransferase